MTAFAIDFRRDRVSVAGDTLGYAPDRTEVKPLGFIPKILPLPHLKAVLFSRGQYQILVSAAAQLFLSPQIMTTEDAAEALPGMLQAATHQYAEQQGIGDPYSVGLLEAALCGWSEAEQRMRIWQFLNYDGYAAQADSGSEYGVLSFPRLPAAYMPRVTGDITDKHLVEVIQAAGRYFVDEPEANCGARVGGEVTRFEITPHGMAQRTIHRFPDYEQVRHASAAIAGRILRGDVDVSRVVADGLVPVADIVDSATGKPLAPKVASLAAAAGNRADRRRAEAVARKTTRRSA
jgi:hypothetical protein